MKIKITFNEDFAAKYGFEITNQEARLLPNDFVMVCFDWDAAKDRHKFKYAQQGSF